MLLFDRYLSVLKKLSDVLTQLMAKGMELKEPTVVGFEGALVTSVLKPAVRQVAQDAFLKSGVVAAILIALIGYIRH